MTKCRALVMSLLLLATVAACSGADPSTWRTASASGARVTGTVVDADGEPASAVRVEVGGVVTTTDVDGRFVFDAVDETYDAAVVARPPHAYVFQSLTSRAPVLKVFDLALSLKSHEGRVHVKLDAPLPDDGKIVVTAKPSSASEGAGERIADVHATPNGDGGVDVDVRWLGGESAGVELLALAYEADPATLAPARYLGAATAEETLLHLGETTWNVALAPVSEAALHAHVAPAADARAPSALAWTSLFLDLGPGAPRTKLADRVGEGTDFDFLVPELAGVSFAVEAVAGARDDLAVAAADGLDAGHPEARLALPDAPTLSSPANGAASVPRSTVFAWEPRGVSWVYFGPRDQAADEPQVWVATPEHATTIPDLRALGIELPRRTDSAWYVVLARGATTVEDAAANGLFADAPGKGGNTAARTFVMD